MSVKVTVDGKTYTGVSTIEVGGKSLSLLAEESATLETQTVSCDATIGDNGGLKISYTPGERAVYVGVPSKDPSSAASSVVAERFANAIVVKVFEDNTAGAAIINNFKSGANFAVTLEGDTVTIPGSAICWLTNPDVQYTFYRIAV